LVKLFFEKRFMAQQIRDSSSSSFVLPVKEGLDQYCLKIRDELEAMGLSTNIMILPYETAGTIVERVRTALTTSDVTRNCKIDVILVPNIFDAALSNKSLPSNLGALKGSPGRKIVYLVDIRDSGVQAALARRDFLKSLGPVIVPAAYFTERDPHKRINAYLVDIEREFQNRNSEELKFSDPYVLYDEMKDNTALVRDDVVRVVDTFILASMLEKASIHKDRDALQNLMTGLHVFSLGLLPVDSSTSAKKKRVGNSQVATRCGLHANLHKELIDVCGRERIRPETFVASTASFALKHHVG
jgi:hypothetical protein